MQPALGPPLENNHRPAVEVRQLETPQAEEQVFEPAQIVGRVGNVLIQAGDLEGAVNQALEPFIGQEPEEELAQQRKLLTKKVLERTIETKLLYLAFLQSGVPTEKLPEIESKLFKSFDENRLEEVMKNAKVASPAELDAKLRKYGSSLDKQRRAFAERTISQQILRREVDFDPEITHDQMLKYFHEHEDDYKIDSRVKWEHLMARFDAYPSKNAARRAIEKMGNDVYLRGAPLATVAKRSSQGANAKEGGQHEWTTPGSLAFDEVDAAIFSIEPGKLSRIIESDQGFHIVRVLEREEASRESFTKAQVEIKEKLRQQIVSESLATYLDELKARTTIWTIYDDEPQTAETDDGAKRR